MKARIPSIETSIGERFLQSSFIVTALALSSIALAQWAQAVSPPPDGGYAGGNTAEGQSALFSLTTGTYNTAVGFLSLRNNTEGQFNTAIGAGALLSNIPGPNNSADGVAVSSQNTAVGTGALLSNTTGANNTAIGAFALFSNTTFGFNTATGSNALFNNTTGTRNNADGAFALASNTTSNSNTATGMSALFSNTEGSFNTATGDSALYSNITGSGNTAYGFAALSNNTSGAQNTASGDSALANNTTGTGNIALGYGAASNVTTASNVICIGYPGANVDNSCFIGHIRGALVGPDAAPVLVDGAGKLGTTTGSSRRFKKEIKPMDKASEAILSLKPVTFQYKSDKTNTPQFGLIAEEVAEVDPDLVVRDEDGEIYTVRYDAVSAMLVNEFLKEHRKVRSLEATVVQQRSHFEVTIAELKKEMENIIARSEEQEKTIQKVSAQVELNKAVSRTVANK
jgi:predicted  nucleic acid-binding Zn-ribbon protein